MDGHLLATVDCTVQIVELPPGHRRGAVGQVQAFQIMVRLRVAVQRISS
jgi:hypothetical protein